MAEATNKTFTATSSAGTSSSADQVEDSIARLNLDGSSSQSGADAATKKPTAKKKAKASKSTTSPNARQQSASSGPAPSSASDNQTLASKLKFLENFLTGRSLELVIKRGCPVKDCSHRWTSNVTFDDINKHLATHPALKVGCGLEKDDGTVCGYPNIARLPWASEHPDSLTMAELMRHREVNHGWPVRPSRAMFYDQAEQQLYMPFDEVLFHCFRKCSSDDVTLNSAKSCNYEGDMCPICFVDLRVASDLRVTNLGDGLYDHFWLKHFITDAGDYDSLGKSVVCQCCDKAVPIYDLFDHLDKTKFNILKSGEADSLDRLKGPSEKLTQFKHFVDWMKKMKRKDGKENSSSAGSSKKKIRNLSIIQ